jgi:hypothetical protein
VRQQRVQQGVGARAVVGRVRLEQRDGLGDGAALRGTSIGDGPAPVTACSNAWLASSSMAALRRLGAPLDLLEHVLRARRDRRAGAVDALHAGGIQEVVVLLRDHAADEDDDVVGALRLQLGDDGRHQRLVAGGQRADAHRVHVVLDRLARAFLGRLEQRAHVDVEAQVGKGRGHHLGAAVVAVLAELGDHHARPAALRFAEGGDLGLQLVPALGRPS